MTIQKKKNLAITVLAFFVATPVFGRTLTVKQERYTHPVPVTKNISADTFLIVPTNPIGPLKPVPVPHGVRLATCLFDFASSFLSQKYKTRLRASLARIDTTKPLVVIGHSCPIGTEKFNIPLSIARAQTVARFLRENGFQVSVTQGVGSSCMVTNNPHLYHLNRRVEVFEKPDLKMLPQAVLPRSGDHQQLHSSQPKGVKNETGNLHHQTKRP